MDLSKTSAIEACDQILSHYIGRGFLSEVMRDFIIDYGGKPYSVETIGRRLRQLGEKGKAMGIPVKGKRYKVWIHQEAEC